VPSGWGSIVRRLLRSQIRALLRAASGRALRLMFPMIAAVREFDEAPT